MLKTVLLTREGLNLFDKPFILFDFSNNTNGYSINSIEGLNPLKANINSEDNTTYYGTEYVSSTIGNRNLVLKMTIRGDYTKNSLIGPAYNKSDSQLIQELFNVVPSGGLVSLKITRDDNKVFIVRGYVESVNPERFSESINCDISIICTSPMFEDPQVVVYSAPERPNTPNPYNASVTFKNNGTEIIGFELDCYISKDLKNFSIEVESNGFAGFKVVNTPMAPSTSVRYSSLFGDLRSQMYPNGVGAGINLIPNMIPSLDNGDLWPKIVPNPVTTTVRVYGEAPTGVNNFICPAFQVKLLQKYGAV